MGSEVSEDFASEVWYTTEFQCRDGAIICENNMEIQLQFNFVKQRIRSKTVPFKLFYIVWKSPLALLYIQKPFLAILIYIAKAIFMQKEKVLQWNRMVNLLYFFKKVGRRHILGIWNSHIPTHKHFDLPTSQI